MPPASVLGAWSGGLAPEAAPCSPASLSSPEHPTQPSHFSFLSDLRDCVNTAWSWVLIPLPSSMTKGKSLSSRTSIQVCKMGTRCPQPGSPWPAESVSSPQRAAVVILQGLTTALRTIILHPRTWFSQLGGRGAEARVPRTCQFQGSRRGRELCPVELFQLRLQAGRVGLVNELRPGDLFLGLWEGCF